MLIFQKFTKLFLSFIFLVGITACGGGGGSNDTSTSPESDASSSGIVLSAGILSPAFAPDTTNYTLNTLGNSTTITANASQANGTITLDGVPINSGETSVEIPLEFATTVIEIEVTSPDGTNTQIYTLTINGPGVDTDTDATLSGLELSEGVVSPAFASGTTNYFITTLASSTTVTPTATQAGATIKVLGLSVNSGEESFAVPTSDSIDIVVTALDGTTTENYTVIINRPEAFSDATLSGLELSEGVVSPTFASGTTNYFITTLASSTTVTPTATQEGATIKVLGVSVNSGEESFAVPTNDSIDIVVTALDGTTTERYTVIISRPVDATLSGLVLSAGEISPVFASDATNYTLSTLSNSTTVTPTVTVAGATVTVDGVPVVSGAASVPVSLTAASTVINIEVTSPNGVRTVNYTVTVTVSSVSSRELLDPTPGASDEFGHTVVQLANGNIVVSDPDDSSVVSLNGAVHLYSPTSPNPIASIYGDVASDHLGEEGIVALPNNNYVIVSIQDDEGGIVNSGSVRLMNGATGAQIAVLSGDVIGDNLGSGGIIALANNNYVIGSQRDDEGGIVNAGSVRLMNGTTGAQIGATLVGDVAGDALGSESIIALANNNFVVASSVDDEGGIQNAGSVRLIDGSTGVQIGATLAGDVTRDNLGRVSGQDGIVALSNNNYIVASSLDDEGGITNAGSVRLMNGATGVQIGSTISGDIVTDSLGSDGITVLANDNFVIASRRDDEGGIGDAGTVRLIDGATGAQISVLSGDVFGDFLGSGGVTAIPNNNYVIASPTDDEGGITNAGSVRLMNGVTGAQIGVTLAGDMASDQLGSDGITVLSNNNYVIASDDDRVSNLTLPGAVRLMNGDTGVQIGATLESGQLHLGGGITALTNNNFVMASPAEDVGGIGNAGSVSLFDGDTGAQIGAALVGDMGSDTLGSEGVIALSNNNYVVVSARDDENGIANAGSVRLMNGNTGAAVTNAIVGESENDIGDAYIIKPVSGDYFILSQPFANTFGEEAGRVRIISP